MEKLMPLKEKFRKNGMDYEIVRGNAPEAGGIAVFKLISKSGAETYEVHKTRVTQVHGVLLSSPTYKNYSHFHRLASNEEFGSHAWSFQNIKDAELKCDELLRKGGF